MNFIKKAKCILVCAVLFSCCDLVADEGTDERESRIAHVLETCSETCYGVRALDGRLGSAVLISAGGRFLTSADLFQSAGEPVTLYQVGLPEILAKVVRIDTITGVALLETDQLRGLDEKLKVAALNSSANTEQLIDVLAFGHASGFRAGRRAPFRFGSAYENEKAQIVSNCRLINGDSGGAIFNLDGQLLGIHRAVDRNGKYANHISVAIILDRWPDLEEAN